MKTSSAYNQGPLRAFHYFSVGVSKTLARARSLSGHIAGLVCAVLVACGGPAEPPPIIDENLIDHQSWRLATDAEDPWRSRLDSLDGGCAELAWGVEGTGDAALLEVETSECSGTAVTHPLEATLQAGDRVTFILWHLPLVKPDVSSAQLGISLNGVPVWSLEVSLPAEATVYQSEFEVPRDIRCADLLTVHVDNHGSNSWRFYTFEYSR